MERQSKRFEDRFERRFAGRRLCSLDLGGGDAPPPPAPDPQIGEAAKISADVAREQLAYQKQRDAQLAPLFQRIIESEAGSMDDNRQRAAQQWQRYQDKGIPLEDKYLEEATNYGTEADQELQAGRAKQDVQHQFDIAEAGNRRLLAQYGVNPGSGRFAGTERAAALSRAAGTAAAGTTARTNARLLGMSMRENAAKFVRGYPTTGIATDAAALNAGTAAGNTAAQQGSIHNAGTTLGLNANAQGANILNQQFDNQNTAYRNALQANRDEWSGLGTAVGIGGAIYSGNPGWLGLARARGGRVYGKRRPVTLNYAAGGKISGPGTTTSDSIPAVVDGEQPVALSDREYVVKADSADKYGDEAMEDVNEGEAVVIPARTLAKVGARTVKQLVLAMAAGGGCTAEGDQHA